MTREFISTSVFQKCWDGLGLGDEEQRNLEGMLLDDPKVGKVIPGTGGARKVRVEYAGKGKRGGARVIYVDILVHETIFFLIAYSKGMHENISESDKKTISSLISRLKDDMDKEREVE